MNTLLAPLRAAIVCGLLAAAAPAFGADAFDAPPPGTPGAPADATPAPAAPASAAPAAQPDPAPAPAAPPAPAPEPPQKPLLAAAAEGDEAAVVQWARSGRADLAERDLLGNSALMLAAQSGAAKAVAALLEAGADAEAANLAGETALHLAAAANQVYAIDQLYTRMKTVDPVAGNKETPLHAAAREGSAEAAARLYEAGARTTVVDSHDPPRSPIILAAQSGHWNVVYALIRRGARYFATDAAAAGDLPTLIRTSMTRPEFLVMADDSRLHGDGMDAMQLAILGGQIPAIEFLRQCGIPVDRVGYGGVPMLFLAAGREDPAMMLYLLDHGSELGYSAPAAQSNTVLHHLARFSTPIFLLRAVQYGADLTRRNYYGDTPLHTAVKRNRDANAVMLARLGSSLNAVNNDGKTPLDMSARRPQLYDELLKIANERAAKGEDGPRPEDALPPGFGAADDSVSRPGTPAVPQPQTPAPAP